MDMLSREGEIRDAYLTGLRNMHALEMSAIELTERQTERLEHYPEMKARLEQHHRESQEQAQRLEAIMERLDTSASSAKNAVSSVIGNVAAALHAPAQDEVLKNTFANFAFEHQEIAAYTSLLAMAEAVGDSSAVPALRQSLSEEQAMADWIEQRIVSTTRRYLELLGQGTRAGV
jgi:ferritin-like metal-binding protein YciE